MEKNCEAADAVNTVCSFNNKRHLTPYAALIVFITASGICSQRDRKLMFSFEKYLSYLFHNNVHDISSLFRQIYY